MRSLAPAFAICVLAASALGTTAAEVTPAKPLATRVPVSPVQQPVATPAPGQCTVTLSGAQTATLPCQVYASTVTVTRGDAGALSLTVQSSANLQVAISIQSANSPAHAGTYAAASRDQAAITVHAGQSRWSASAVSKPGAPTTFVGTYTWTITSVVGQTSVQGGTIYADHGTIDATLPATAATGATGTVMLHATF